MFWNGEPADIYIWKDDIVCLIKNAMALSLFFSTIEMHENKMYHWQWRENRKEKEM